MRKIGLSILLASIICLCSNATDVTLYGNWRYNVDFSRKMVRIQGDKIENKETGGISGTLKLRLYLTDTKYMGEDLSGYLLAEYKLNQLKGGYYYQDFNQLLNFSTNPPEGTYNVVLTLLEYSSGDYYIIDYLNFNGSITFDYSTETLSDGLNEFSNALNNNNSNYTPPANTTSCDYFKIQYEKQRVLLNSDIKRLTKLRQEGKNYGKYGEEFASKPNPAMNVAILKSIRTTQKLMTSIRERAASNGCVIPMVWEEYWQ